MKLLPGFQSRHEGMPHGPVLDRKAAGAQQTVLHVAGVDCPEEVATIKHALEPLPGVSDVRVNILSGRTTIAHDSNVTPDSLIRAIADAGLKATRDAGRKEPGDGPSQKGRLISVGISGLFTVTGLLVHWLKLGPEWPHTALFFGAIITGGWFIFPKAIGAVRRLHPT